MLASVDSDAVRAVGLGGAQQWPGGPVDVGAAEPDRRVSEVDVCPSQPGHLAASRPGRGRQPQIGGEIEIGLFDRCDKALNLVRCWGKNLGRCDAGWACVGCRVEPDPLPTNRLGQRPMQHDVHAVHSARRQRPPVAPATARQQAVHVVDVDRGQLVDPDVAEQWANHGQTMGTVAEPQSHQRP